MAIKITITNAGSSISDLLDIYTNSGGTFSLYISDVSKSSLLSGYTFTPPVSFVGTPGYRVKDKNCLTILDLYCSGTTTTTTTTIAATTTTTTTLALPTISTSLISSIGCTSATGGGSSITGVVTQKGVCWNTTGSPTISNSKTTNGSGTSPFSSSITGLSPSQIYYVRAYATNSSGTAYGSQRGFTTSTLSTPDVTTGTVTPGDYDAYCSLTLVNSNCSSVTAYGLVWAYEASADPDITTKLGITTGGSGYMSPLTTLTNYKCRAYATNGEGTSYGSIVHFTTVDVPVTTTTTTYTPPITTTTTTAATTTTTTAATTTTTTTAATTTTTTTAATTTTTTTAATTTTTTTAAGTTTTTTTHAASTALNFGSLHNYQSESCVDSSVNNTVYVSTAVLASSGGNLTAGMKIYWDTSLTSPWEVYSSFSEPNPGSYVSFTYQYNTIHYATVSISHHEDGSTTGIINSVENCCNGVVISCTYATSKSNYCNGITENRHVYTDTGNLYTATSIFMTCSSNPSERFLAESGVYAYYDIFYWNGQTVESYNCPTTTTTTVAPTTTTTTVAPTTTTTTLAHCYPMSLGFGDDTTTACSAVSTTYYVDNSSWDSIGYIYTNSNCSTYAQAGFYHYAPYNQIRYWNGTDAISIPTTCQ